MLMPNLLTCRIRRVNPCRSEFCTNAASVALVAAPQNRIGSELRLIFATAVVSNEVPPTASWKSKTCHECGNHDGVLSATTARQACVTAEHGSRPFPIQFPLWCPAVLVVCFARRTATQRALKL